MPNGPTTLTCATTTRPAVAAGCSGAVVRRSPTCPRTSARKRPAGSTTCARPSRNAARSGPARRTTDGPARRARWRRGRTTTVRPRRFRPPRLLRRRRSVRRGRGSTTRGRRSPGPGRRPRGRGRGPRGSSRRFLVRPGPGVGGGRSIRVRRRRLRRRVRPVGTAARRLVRVGFRPAGTRLRCRRVGRRRVRCLRVRCLRERCLRVRRLVRVGRRRARCLRERCLRVLCLHVRCRRVRCPVGCRRGPGRRPVRFRRRGSRRVGRVGPAGCRGRRRPGVRRRGSSLIATRLPDRSRVPVGAMSPRGRFRVASRPVRSGVVGRAKGRRGGSGGRRVFRTIPRGRFGVGRETTRPVFRVVRSRLRLGVPVALRLVDVGRTGCRPRDRRRSVGLRSVGLRRAGLPTARLPTLRLPTPRFRRVGLRTPRLRRVVRRKVRCRAGGMRVVSLPRWGLVGAGRPGRMTKVRGGMGCLSPVGAPGRFRVGSEGRRRGPVVAGPALFRIGRPATSRA